MSASIALVRSEGGQDFRSREAASANPSKPLLLHDFDDLKCSHEEQRGAAPVAILSHDFWSRTFNEDRSVIGKTIALDGTTYTIVPSSVRVVTTTVTQISSGTLEYEFGTELVNNGL